MTVKEILNHTANLLGEDEVCSLLSEKAPENSEYATQTLKLLKRSLDVITDEIACEFYPLKAMQTFEVNSGKIYYSDFLSTPIKIVEVVDKNNQKCPYKLVSDHLTTTNGERTVTYEYKPKPQSDDEEALFSNSIIGENILCWGMCAEFCFARGRYAESERWREKFLTGLSSRIFEREVKRIPQRRWF